MKTKADKTLPFMIIGLGMVFIVPAILSSALQLPARILWSCIGMFFVLPGLWKIEHYKLTGNKLLKVNFLGLFSRTADLTTLVHYDIKQINTDFNANPLNMIRFFSKDIRYLKYRKVILMLNDGSKITLDERTIQKADFKRLFEKIKGFKSRQRK